MSEQGPATQEKGRIDPLRIIRLLMVCSFFLYFLITFLRIPLHNFDFWWHLATGRYIVENGALPSDDPFTYTTDNDNPLERKSVILRGNWLGQTIFYVLYRQWDAGGIIMLRALLLLLFLFSIFRTIRKQNVSPLIALIFTAGVFLTANSYSGERPQLFTFLVFSMVFSLLEDFRIERSKKAYLIPLLVLFLANIHPGYIICIALITLYLAGEGARALLKKDYRNPTLQGLVLIWILTILLSLVNPNGATMITGMFSTIQGDHIKGIVEFRPTFSLYLTKVTPVNYAYMTFLVLSLAGLLYLRRIPITHLMVLVLFTAMSFLALRYLIFYMAVAAPILAGILAGVGEEKRIQKYSALLRAVENRGTIIACALGILLVFFQIPALARHDFREETFHNVPQAAADFLGDTEIRGNMFNEYGFGGYLIWRLYPGKRVFIDGRALEPVVYTEYQVIAYALENPVVTWEDILDQYGITYVIMPPLLHHGSIYPIVEKLFESREWSLIYMDHLSLIFLRDNGQNSSLKEKYAIDKQKGLETIIVQASAKALKNPGNPYFLITLGKVFLRMGRFDDAEKALLMARERDRENPEIQRLMENLRESRTHDRTETLH